MIWNSGLAQCVELQREIARFRQFGFFASNLARLRAVLIVRRSRRKPIDPPEIFQ